jgi:hypothetical protein
MTFVVFALGYLVLALLLAVLIGKAIDLRDRRG